VLILKCSTVRIQNSEFRIQNLDPERRGDMRILINGKPTDLPERITIEDMVELKGLNPDTIVVECNMLLVKRENWAGVVLRESDSLEILSFVGGG